MSDVMRVLVPLTCLPTALLSQSGLLGTPDGNQAFARREMNASGATYEVRFDAPGRYKYFCEVHRNLGMTGEVVVQ